VTNPNTQPAASNDPFAGIIDNLHAAFVGEPTADQGDPVNFGGEHAQEPALERTPAQGVCEGILLAVIDGWYTVRGIAHRTQISPPYITDALAACSLVAPTGGGEPGNEEYVPTAEGVLKAQERGWALPSYTPAAVEPAPVINPRVTVQSNGEVVVKPAPVATKAKRGGWNGMPTSEARDVTNQIISDQGLCPKWVTDVASGPFLDNLVHGSARDVKKAVTGCLDPAALRGVIDRELAQPRIRKGNLSTALNRLAKLVGLNGEPVAAPPLTAAEQPAPERVVEVKAVEGDDTAAVAAAPVPAAVAADTARTDAATAQVAVADAVGEIATLTAHVAALTAQVQSVDARRIESDREITRLRGIIDGHAAATKVKDDCLADRDQNIEGLQATVEQLERDLDRALDIALDRTDAQQALLAITAQLIDRIAAQ